MIPVTVTALAHFGTPDGEMVTAVLRGGLVYREGQGWFATQEELDTPHDTFRLSPR